MTSIFRRIYSAAAREFAAEAASPAAWVFLVIFLVMSAFCALISSGLFTSGQADLTPFFDWMPWLFLFIVPALGMPLWSEERKTGSFELILSFPAGLLELVLGKFLAGLGLLAVALLLTASIPLTALYLGSPDTGAVLSGYLGSLMLGGVYLSIACFCSAMSKSQTASFLLSLLICAILMFIGWPALTGMMTQFIPEQLVEFIASCAFLPHFQAFQRGIMDTGEIIYCLSMTAFFLYLATASLEFASSGTGNIFAPGALNEQSTRRAFRKFALGTLAAAFALICVNITASTFYFRFDMSSDSAYSISERAKKLAASVDSPATIRFYATQSGTRMPAAMKKYAERVKWLLEEFCSASNGIITLKVINPEPDSEDEEAAILEGVTPVNVNTGDRVFLGIAVSCADKFAPIPFLSPQQENTLEYEIARALLNVTRKTRPKIGVMSALPVTGSEVNQELTRLHPEKAAASVERPWYAISELAADNDIVKIPLDTADIPDDISALLIIHPAGIQERTLYAIDQYLLRGGKIAAFLDPRSLYSQIKAKTDQSYMDKFESSLGPLTAAWGVNYKQNLLIADMVYAYRRMLPDRMITNPLALSLTQNAISRDNPLTLPMNEIVMYFTGFLPAGEEKKGLTSEVILSSSKESQIVNSLIADRTELVIRNFRSSGETYPLGRRIYGSFKSAFPWGAPDASAADSGKKHLVASAKDSEVFLFADSDMLFNDVCVKYSEDALGQRTLVRQNDNLSLLQNIMEHLCASDEGLSEIRNRIPMSRPLSRINEIKARAELTYKNRILELEKGLGEAQSRVRKIQGLVNAGIQTKLTQEQEQELREFSYRSANLSRELKALRKQLRSDLDSLDTKIRLFNLLAVPLAVALSGIVWSFIRLSKWRRRK